MNKNTTSKDTSQDTKATLSNQNTRHLSSNELELYTGSYARCMYIGQSGDMLEIKVKENKRAIEIGNTDTLTVAEHTWKVIVE